MARSSSSSASWPVAMTPPSRTSAAGSSADARATSSVGDRRRRRQRFGEHAEQQRAFAAARAARTARQREQRRAQAGQLARPRLAQGDARGDALDVGEMPRSARAQRRRAVRLQARRSPRGAGVATRRSRSGCVQPWRSGAAAHAGARRCRAAKTASARPGRAACASARGCGAWSAAGRSGRWRAAPEPLHVRQRAALRVLGVAQQRRRGRVRRGAGFGAEAGQGGDAQLLAGACARRAPPSNCHVGRRVSVLARGIAGAGGQRRRRRGSRPARAARSSRSSSASLHSARPSSPFESASQARPKRCCGPAATASSSASLLSASRSLSVSVPGVTTRTTLRSTGPLLAPTSPTCSQIATDSPELDQPRQVALDRVHRHAGHRDRRAAAGPRAVSVMSSRRAAFFASSRRARRNRPSGRTAACPDDRP